MSCKTIVILLLALNLTACGDASESDDLNQLFLTFYPPQSAFPSDVADDEVVSYKRLLVANGIERVNITLNQRRDGEAPTSSEGKPSDQYAVFKVTYGNSNTFDIYDENQVFLYTHTVFAEDQGKHFCISIDQQDEQLIESELPLSFPADSSETHQFIKQCRVLNNPTAS
ncbi:hypothetical protein ACVFI8_09610 [Agarivorans sp. MS3-6]